MTKTDKRELDSKLYYYRLLSVDQVGALLGVDPQSIKAWSREGKFPKPIRFNARVYRWPLTAVLDFIESKQAATSRQEK